VKTFHLAILKSSDNNLPKVNASQDTLNTLFNIGFAIIGALAVLFLVIAGLKYITSQGEPARVETAKNQILYALIGLVIVASAAAAVNFVLGRA
jgi:putative copper export protein